MSDKELPYFTHLIGKIMDDKHHCDICEEEARRYAIVLRTDGTTEKVPFPENVTEQVSLIQEKIGGNFDTSDVWSEKGDFIEYTLWVHDEGLLIGLPINEAASELNAIGWWRRGYDEQQARSQSTLVGDAVITTGPDVAGDVFGFSDYEADGIIKVLKKLKVIAG